MSEATHRPKTKHNTRYNLRQKAAHRSINTEKDKGVPAEFKFPEREGAVIELIQN